MLRTLALLRHGLATGQGPDASLTPQGTQQLRKLAAVLRAEGWRPDTILVSPYARAVESARTLATGIGFATSPIVLHELMPEREPIEALQAIDHEAGGAATILAVTHLPLVGRIARELTGEEVSFTPGTLALIADHGDGEARLVRRFSPEEL